MVSNSLTKSALPLGEILKFVKNFWGESNVQLAVLGSLAFQILLVFCAPLRKRSKRARTLVILWLVYQLSHYVATFAIGLINNYGPGPTKSSSKPGELAIIALWAPFLLLHLGGPDTITAFAMEDNDLWLRSLLTLIVQVLSVLFVLYRFRILTNNEFLAPTLLTFAAGIIKYSENIRSLNLASLVSMRKSMRSVTADDDEVVTRTTERMDGEMAVQEDNGGKDRGIEIVKMGFELYGKYKAVIVDHVFSFTSRNESRGYFRGLSSYKDAFDVMEVELNFMYDAMFTKMVAVQGNYPGYIFRVLCAALITSSLVIFVVQPKHSVRYPDVRVTYCLMISALVLDLIALAKHIFSEWTIALMLKNPRWSMRAKMRWARVVNIVKEWISSEMRWSDEMKQYSLITHSMKSEWEWMTKVYDFFGLTERMEASQNTKTEAVEQSLKEMIFEEIKKKAEHAETDEKAKEMCSHKGKYALTECENCFEMLEPKIREAEDDNQVLMWHIATEICYFTAEKEDRDPNPEICRQVSEYLAYLLMMEGNISSAVPGNVGMRFRDICWEEVRDTKQHLKDFIKVMTIIGAEQNRGVGNIINEINTTEELKSVYWYPQYQMTSIWKEMKKLFPQKANLDDAERRRELTEWERKQKKKEFEERKKACQMLLAATRKNSETNVNFEPPRKSLLFDALEVARRLRELIGDDVENQRAHSELPQKKHVWEMMARIWVEMLCYAASHCKGDVQYLTQGGELLTFVRLLMAHFGLGEQFKKEEDEK